MSSGPARNDERSRRSHSLLSEFRGLPESAVVDRRPATSLASLVEVCINRYKIGQDTPEECIMRNWRRIVGDRFAARCAPERIDSSGTLLIKVSSPVLKRELQFTEARILTVIGSIEGCENITGIAFKHG